MYVVVLIWDKSKENILHYVTPTFWDNTHAPYLLPGPTAFDLLVVYSHGRLYVTMNSFLVKVLAQNGVL